MNLIQLLQQQAQAQAERTALIHGGQSLSYEELETKSRQLAQRLHQNGLRPGDKVLLFVPVSLPLYLLFLAIVRLGAVVVFIDPALGKQKLNQAVATLKPEYFLGSALAQFLRLLPAIAQIPRKFWAKPLLKQASHTTLSNPQADFPTPAEHPALITFTSGSTGIPKAILRSHGFLIEQNRCIQNSLNLSPQAVELNTLPVFVLSSLASGSSVLLAQHKPHFSPRKLQQLAQQIRQHQVSQILTSPDFLDQLCSHLAIRNQTLPQIQKIFTGGAPIFANLLQKIAHQLPKAQVTTVYGSTEAEPMAHHQLAKINRPAAESNTPNKPGLLAGKPIPEIRLAILQDQDDQALGKLSQAEFHALQLPPNQVGEILVTGAHVLKHYLHGDENKTKLQVEEEIWHRTGDAGYLDEQGQLWLLGRCSAKVSHQGQVLYPFAFEAKAMSIAEVKQAALVQVQEKLVLAITTNSDKPAQLKASLQAQLPELERVEILQKLPTDPRHHSKILYSTLAKQLAKRRTH